VDWGVQVQRQDVPQPLEDVDITEAVKASVKEISRENAVTLHP
jgi:hypothetical protein